MTSQMRAKFLFLWKTLAYSGIWRIFMLLYILVPIILKLFPSIFLQTVFSNKYKGPAVYNKLSQPEKDWNFPKSSNQYVRSHSGNMLGVWYLPPNNTQNPSLSKAEKIVLYCHGKSGNRATGHRTGVYNVLRNMGFHVVAFDYSGFGDSSGNPDGRVVVLDTITVYEWLLDQVQRKDAKILVWGHSLGSGVVTSAMAEISTKHITKLPHGVILESTFTNLFDASKHSPLFKLFDVMYPYVFRKMFKQAARYNKMEFEMLKDLPKIKSHFLILHSEDDPKIDVKLSQKLYDNVASNPDTLVETVQYYRINSQYALGHNLVYSYKNLNEILENFMTSMQKPSVIVGKMRYEQFRV